MAFFAISDRESIEALDELQKLLSTSKAEIVRRCIKEYRQRHLDGLYFHVDDIKNDIKKYTIRKELMEQKIERLQQLLNENIENNKNN